MTPVHKNFWWLLIFSWVKPEASQWHTGSVSRTSQPLLHISESLHTPLPLVLGLPRLPPAAGHSSAGSGNAHFSGKALADLVKICTTASTSPIFTPSLWAPCLISSSVEFLPLSSLKWRCTRSLKWRCTKLNYKIKSTTFVLFTILPPTIISH